MNPQFYAFRWITLLLTQEFNFADSLLIWDTLLSDPEGPQASVCPWPFLLFWQGGFGLGVTVFIFPCIFFGGQQQIWEIGIEDLVVFSSKALKSHEIGIEVPLGFTSLASLGICDHITWHALVDIDVMVKILIVSLEYFESVLQIPLVSICKALGIHWAVDGLLAARPSRHHVGRHLAPNLKRKSEIVSSKTKP